MKTPKILTIALILLLITPIKAEDLFGSKTLRPNRMGQLSKEVRYTPENNDFIIINGKEFFNRPLYGGNTAFRVDAGDRPEFVMYLPGRGGNLRLAIRKGEQTKWIHEFAYIKAAYRAGSMIYEIRDSALLGNESFITLTALALRDQEGLILQVETSTLPEGTEILWAYGGVNGKRGKRDGDIGTEKVPISQWFQLQPEFAIGNKIKLGQSSMVLHSKAGKIQGAFPPGSTLQVQDANLWNTPDSLFTFSSDTTTFATPILTGKVNISSNQKYYLGFQKQNTSEAGLSTENLETLFTHAESERESIASQISIKTPDEYLNAAVSALCVAADAVWDEPEGAVMHGAIAWRRKLLGWRGPYSMDALGWHERASRHLSHWPSRQNTNPIPDSIAPPEEKTNLARMERSLHTNGDMSNAHYDMNLVYIDALFRHLMWTGDLEFAKEVWPAIERHLAWERRLFRREFGSEKLPLYEAYAAIWASDGLQYNGGGVAYTSAYNYWHNLQAAQLAQKLDLDGSFYQNEAQQISKAMRELLWMPEAGMFAEYKDMLGNQLLHPQPGLWTFYHILDSEFPTPDEALSMSRWVDENLPHIPVYGNGIPDNEEFYMLPTTNWMPYTWSINNVCMNENIHAALAYWKAGRTDEAYRITHSSILASMFMGICPGNVGSMNYLDVYRRESQRDFADGSGVLSRAIVEGLFGMQTDLLNEVVHFRPGFPEDWEYASIHHPDFDVKFNKEDNDQHYSIETRFSKPVKLQVSLPANSSEAKILVNGKEIQSTLDTRYKLATLNFEAEVGNNWDIQIEWLGSALDKPDFSIAKHTEKEIYIPGISDINWDNPIPEKHKLDAINLTSAFNDEVSNIFEKGKYRTPRSPGVSLRLPAQGLGSWAGNYNETAEIDDSGLRAQNGILNLKNGAYFITPKEENTPNVAFVSQWDNYPNNLIVPVKGKARRLFLLMAGTTYHMQSRLENARVTVTYADDSQTTLPLINPTNWWPIEQDYFIDDYQFSRPGPLPPRVDLKTGEVRYLKRENFVGTGGNIEGGAATVFALPLDATKKLKLITVEAIANEVVIGLMAATLER